MYCGHSFCFECIQKEIEIQIKERKFPVSCRIDKCNSEIMIHEIEKFIGIEKTEKYLFNYIETQIQISKKYVKCTFPNCPYFLNKKSFNCCNIGQCKCGHRFCLKCQQNDHSPINCDQVHEWEIISQKMNKIMADQKEWEIRESSLWQYRRRNIGEIKKVIKEHLNQVNSEYEKIFNSSYEKPVIHDFYKLKKENEVKIITKFLNDYINALKNDQKWFLEPDKRFIIHNEMNYLKLTVKKCPKCNVTIGKEGGCNHMICSICKHNFCWLCLKDWKLHDELSKCPLENDSSIDKNENEEINQDIKEIFILDPKIKNNISSILYNNATNPLPIHSKKVDSKNEYFVQDFVLNDDHKFTLPPVIAQTHFKFQRWERLNRKYELHMRQIQNRPKLNDELLIDLFIRLHSVLAHSYQLLFFLDPSGTSYNMFDIQVKNLEKISIKAFSNTCVVERSIQSVLKTANEINFLKR